MKRPFARIAAAVLLAAASVFAVAQDKKDTVRPEVGKPLQAAQELLKAEKSKEALEKIDEADAVSDKTGFEVYVISRLRISAALGAGDVPAAITGFDGAIASGRLTPEEQREMMLGLARSYYSQKNFAKAAAWAARNLKEGGTDPQARLLMIQSYYLANDFNTAARELAADGQAAAKDGKFPPEDKMRLLAGCYQKLDDAERYRAILEKLVTHYPKTDYWSQWFYRTRRGSTDTAPLALDLRRSR